VHLQIQNLPLTLAMWTTPFGEEPGGYNARGVSQKFKKRRLGYDSCNK